MLNTSMSNYKMPVLFIGHGSPMNAIAQNQYTKALQSFGQKLKRPKAIVCISAHWVTNGVFVTGMQSPKTIHDFYGFPQELFQVQYSAPGDPELAQRLREKNLAQIDEKEWGLDHGAWSVLRHVFPRADIPVVQLSLDLKQPLEFHLKLGEQLRFLREQEVLIIGSGNIVHNLRMLKWEEGAPPWPWAIEFDQWVQAQVSQKNSLALCNSWDHLESGRLSVPTLEHFAPLIVSLGASDSNDPVQVLFEQIQNASISMRSFCWGSL